jgi:antitoxin (DNA-binding transcriptional repressor) of toxin-antitoxin stability system
VAQHCISAGSEKLHVYEQERGMPVYSFAGGCKISLVSTGPQLVPSAETQERNWLPLVVAAAIMLVVAVAAVLILEHGKPTAKVTPISAPPDAYAASLPLTNLVMSESGNLAGGKVTYIDGHIANKGGRIVTGVTVQVLFRDFAHEVAQNETQSLKLIRMREPYIDIEPVSAAPLKPGEQDFRLIFDAVSPDWDGAYPEVRVVHVETK